MPGSDAMSKDFGGLKMKSRVRTWWSDKGNVLIALLMVVGCVIRLYGTSKVPGGLNQDEAYAGYNAWSLLNYGVDSFGYHNPVYFTTWGSGMNALETYLMIPFIAIFGRKAGAVRLPQGIVACLSLWVFYLLIKELKGKRTAIMGLFVFVVCPWHVMMARWGLEANLLPGFLLFGFYFFVLAVKRDIKYIYASVVCYGLSLYCYSVIWPVLPFMILFQGAYCIWCKKLSPKNRHLWIAVAILGLMALPLFLFLLVNAGVIGEIKTAFISVPRLVSMRDDEISLSAILGNARTLLRLLTSQSDGLLYNASSDYGIYYKFGNWLAVLGVGVAIAGAAASVRNRQFDIRVLLCIQLVGGIVLGTLINVTVNRCNCIWIPLLMCIVLGISELVERFGKQCWYGLVVAYAVSFVSFALFYITDFRYNVVEDYYVGAGQIVGEAAECDGEILVDDGLYYSVVMFYDGMSPYEFMETVQWNNYPSKYLKVDKAGRYRFMDVDEIGKYDSKVCIVRARMAGEIAALGYETYTYKGYTIGVRP
jgi:hypothetical protein